MPANQRPYALDNTATVAQSVLSFRKTEVQVGSNLEVYFFFFGFLVSFLRSMPFAIRLPPFPQLSSTTQ